MVLARTSDITSFSLLYLALPQVMSIILLAIAIGSVYKEQALSLYNAISLRFRGNAFGVLIF